MKFERFEDMDVWKKSQELALNMYSINISNNKDYGFFGQLQRAGVSISNNIAEGFERKSNQEFKHFLFIAKGSAGEVRSMLYLAKDLQYITEDKFKELLENSLIISKMLSSLIKKL